MLTPVDIQQKKFRTGLGYEKKDVNAFFEIVSDSYEKLYRSNAELKEKVLTLTDGLQNYKSKEAELEKSIMIAEKDSEEAKSKALKEAKNIELDAKNKAKNIVADAEKQLAEITAKITELETQYAAYKSNFVYFMKKQFEQLEVEDFDPKSYIDEKSLQTLGVSAGGSGAYKGKSSGPNMPFGSFNGDPQMRDESTLGGYNGGSSGGMSSRPEDKVSTSAVYTSNLSAGENFVDPFNPDAKKQEGRYNPYDGRTVTNKKKGESSFTVNKDGMSSGGKYSSRSNTRTTQTKKTTSSSSSSSTTRKTEDKSSDKKSDPTHAVKSEASAKKETDAKIKDIVGSKVNGDKSSTKSAQSEKPKKPVVDNIFTFEKDVKPAPKADSKADEDEKKDNDDIPTLNFGEEDVEVETVKDSNLIGNGDDDESEDFEFV